MSLKGSRNLAEFMQKNNIICDAVQKVSELSMPKEKIAPTTSMKHCE